MKKVYLVSLQMSMKMELYPWLLGSSPMKSMVRTLKGCVGIGIGWSSPYSRWQACLVFWHIGQVEMNWCMSLVARGIHLLCIHMFIQIQHVQPLWGICEFLPLGWATWEKVCRGDPFQSCCQRKWVCLHSSSNSWKWKEACLGMSEWQC